MLTHPKGLKEMQEYVNCMNMSRKFCKTTSPWGFRHTPAIAAYPPVLQKGCTLPWNRSDGSNPNDEYHHWEQESQATFKLQGLTLLHYDADKLVFTVVLFFSDHNESYSTLLTKNSTALKASAHDKPIIIKNQLLVSQCDLEFVFSNSLAVRPLYLTNCKAFALWGGYFCFILHLSSENSLQYWSLETFELKRKQRSQFFILHEQYKGWQWMQQDPKITNWTARTYRWYWAFEMH